MNCSPEHPSTNGCFREDKMDKIMLSTIALLALIGTMYFVNTGRTKTARNIALLLLGLSAIMWLTS